MKRKRMPSKSKKSTPKSKKFVPFGVVEKRLRLVIVMLVVAITGVWFLIFTRAATPPSVRFVYVYAKDQPLSSKQSWLGSLASEIKTFYTNKTGRSFNSSTVGHIQGAYTAAQYIACPSGQATCSETDRQSALLSRLRSDSRIYTANAATLVITQFHTNGSGVNCGLGDWVTSNNYSGGAISYATTECQSYARTRDAAAHELGHNFGLDNPSGHTPWSQTGTGPLMVGHTSYGVCDNDWSRCWLDDNDIAWLRNNPIFGAAVTQVVTTTSLTHLLHNYNAGGGVEHKFTYGKTGDKVLYCDWDGDGDDTIGIYRASETKWYLNNEHDSSTSTSFGWGSTSDKYPICGDWDGDGDDTPGFFRPPNWLLRNHNSGGGVDIQFGWGSSTDKYPLVGDWNGDGKDTPGLFRPPMWLLSNHNSSGGVDYEFGWGSSSDKYPLVGDWNGDGKDTPGQFRPTTWLLSNHNSSGGVDIQFGWGSSVDNPVIGDWNNDGKDTVGAWR